MDLGSNYTGDYPNSLDAFAEWPANVTGNGTDPVTQLLAVDGSGEPFDADQMCTVSSTNCECHSWYQFYDYEEKLTLGQISLVFIGLGICANVLSVAIFTSRTMRVQPINWYLAVLSFSDTLILFSAFFVLALPRLGEYLFYWNAVAISYWMAPYFYGLMTMAQTVSVCMTVGMSVHRYVGVCFPFKACQILTNSRVRAFILGLVAFSIVFNSTRFWEVHVVNNCYRYNIDQMMPVLSPTPLRLSATYRLIFFGWAYTIVMFIVPFSILIFVNAHVIFAMRKSNRRHNNYDDSMSRTKTESKERKTTIMLIAIVFVFLFCNALAFIINILENLNYVNGYFAQLVTASNVLVLVNASSNIIIYFVLSDKYRSLFLQYTGFPFCFCGQRRVLYSRSLEEDVKTTTAL